MHCPICNSQDTKVIDSRLTGEGTAIRRRRECEKCNYRFSTNEEVELLDLTVVKRDGKREPYNRNKIEIGLNKALEKRPYTAEKFRRLLSRIERDIQKHKDSAEITSQQIGEIVMRHLRGFDSIGYLRFASVYRSFRDIDAFINEVRTLKKK